MDSLSYKTISANAATVTKEWVVIDATNEVLGRLASQIAKILRGKHKPEYTPHVDTGDYIVVINADKLKLSAEKAGKKTYYRHTGYPGGIYETTFKEMQAKHPGRALEIAVKGMLPKNTIGRTAMTRLKLFKGPGFCYALYHKELPPFQYNRIFQPDY